MKFLLFASLAVLALAATPRAVAASDSTTDFNGHYRLVKNGDKFFELHVEQKGPKAEVEFSAGHVDGHGAAPDGAGAGRVKADGSLSFSFEDSFSNHGRGTLRFDGKAYRLVMEVTESPGGGRGTELYGKLHLHRLLPKKKSKH